MIGTIGRAGLGVAMIAALTACGNTRKEADPGDAPLGIAAKTVAQVIATGATKRAAPKAPPSPAQMAAEALAANPGPLILAGFEAQGNTQVLALMAENGGMRTYMTKGKQALILRGGMLTGTRGFGHDMSVAEAGELAALIRAGRSGQGERVIRSFSGDGKERPLRFACTVAPGPKPGVMTEDCTGHGARFQNSYMVSGGGIGVSRQWAGPGMGYITIQTLRP